MTKIKIQEDEDKVVAWQKRLFQKNLQEKITFYKKLQEARYNNLVEETRFFFDTKLEVEEGLTYFYENGEFQFTEYLTGYALGGGASYRVTQAYPFNKDILKKNENAIKSIENLVGRIIIKRSD